MRRLKGWVVCVTLLGMQQQLSHVGPVGRGLTLDINYFNKIIFLPLTIFSFLTSSKYHNYYCRWVDDPYKFLLYRIAPNFTHHALSTYLYLKQSVVLLFLPLALTIQPLNPYQAHLVCCNLNLAISQIFLVCPYLSNDSCHWFNTDYNLFDVGLYGSLHPLLLRCY